MRLPRDYVVVDLETTGLDPRSSRIIEVGVAPVVNGLGLGVWTWLVHTDESLPAEIVRITGITDYMVNSCANKWDDVALWLSYLIRDLPVVGHNFLSFDRLFLEEVGIPINVDRVWDTMAIYKGYKMRNVYMDESVPYWRYQVAILNSRVPGLKTNLAAACADMGITTDKNLLHRAEGDVKATQKLFEKLRGVVTPL